MTGADVRSPQFCQVLNWIVKLTHIELQCENIQLEGMTFILNGLDHVSILWWRSVRTCVSNSWGKGFRIPDSFLCPLGEANRQMWLPDGAETHLDYSGLWSLAPSIKLLLAHVFCGLPHMTLGRHLWGALRPWSPPSWFYDDHGGLCKHGEILPSA